MDTLSVFGHTGLNNPQLLDSFINKILLLYALVEGGYDAINASDGPAMSIGILQWHGCRAKKLLRNLIRKDEIKSKSILSGTQICTDMDRNDAFWNQRIAYPHEIAQLKALLSSPPGKQTQDALAKEDIIRYLLHGIALGITDLRALAYFCDLENQGGEYVAGDIVHTLDETNPITLDRLCIAALTHPLMGVARRRRRIYCYRKISEFFQDNS